MNTTDNSLDTVNEIQYTTVSRRNFLKSGSLFAAGLALGLPWLTGCKKDANGLVEIWNELADKLEGRILLPDVSGFKDKARPWALQHAQVWPSAIAECVNKNDVRECILWAKNNNVAIVARSGGHSYGGYSTTSGLMIDVSLMNKVEYDAATQLIKVEGGGRNRQVFEAGKVHNVAITHGRCFGVGVAGLTLGGGIGFDMRMNGYTCDKLVETEIVLANGETLTCNETTNSDLFWACRGAGGGNLGINTSFTFKAFKTGNITIFNISWDKNIEKLFETAQTIIKDAPNQFGMKLSVTAIKNAQDKNDIQLSILGSYDGSKEALLQIIHPMLVIQEPKSKMVEVKPYWDGQEIISEEGKPERMHERSRFVSGYLGKEALNTILNNLNSWPGTSKAVTWKFFLLGGAIDEKAPADMAMVHRGYTMLSSIDLEWTEKDDSEIVAINEMWLDSFHQQMQVHTSDACYQNFIDPSETNYLNAYYGENLSRLREIKRKYDPSNMFTYAQAIPL